MTAIGFVLLGLACAVAGFVASLAMAEYSPFDAAHDCEAAINSLIGMEDEKRDCERRYTIFLADHNRLVEPYRSQST